MTGTFNCCSLLWYIIPMRFKVYTERKKKKSRREHVGGEEATDVFARVGVESTHALLRDEKGI